MLNENVAVEPKVSRETEAKSQTVAKAKTASKTKASKQVSGTSKKSPPPYHIFTVLGDYFVFDTSSSRFYEIDLPSFKFLKLCLTKTLQEAETLFREESEFPKDITDSVISFIKTLSDNGLFDTMNYSVSKKDINDKLKDINTTPLHQIELMLTDGCNMACKYCYQSAHKDSHIKIKTKTMTKKIASKAIDILFSNAGKAEKVNILLFGGEPLLNEKVLRHSVEYAEEKAKQCGKIITFSMTTNGTLLNSAIVDFIVKHNIFVMVSLDGPKNIHDSQRLVKDGTSAYDLARKGTEMLMAKCSKVNVQCTLPSSFVSLKELIIYFEDMGFNKIIMGPVQSRSGISLDLDFTDDNFGNLIKQYDSFLIPRILKKIKNGEELSYNPFENYFDIIQRGTPSFSVYNCPAGHRSVSVNPDGLLFPCSKFAGLKNWEVGNVEDGIEYNRAKKMWFDYAVATSLSSCRSCWAYTLCATCPWLKCSNDGTFSVENYSCSFRRNIFERTCYVFSKIQALTLDGEKSEL